MSSPLGLASKIFWQRVLVSRFNTYRLPLFALVDADPYGLHILECYRAGGLAAPAQNEPQPPPVPIKWLGLRRRDIADAQRGGPGGEALQMTEQDRLKAVNLLANGKTLDEAER